jgi:hypothetical protein
MPIRILLKENTQPNDLFQKNLDKVNTAFSPNVYGDQNITPENSEILTQIEIGDEIGRGAFGKVYNIKNSSHVIKLFVFSVDEQADMKRMKGMADKIFAGSATLGDMHYFEYGTIGNELKYAIMPRIIPFEKSNVYRLNKKVFLAVSEALHRVVDAGRDKLKSYADFRDIFYHRLAKELVSEASYEPEEKREEFKNNFLSELNELDETIHKILRIAHKTYIEQGGKDLHLGNLGFFAQKPDDWFFFDM